MKVKEAVAGRDHGVDLVRAITLEVLASRAWLAIFWRQSRYHWVKAGAIAVLASHTFFFLGDFGTIAFLGYSTISKPSTLFIHFFFRIYSFVRNPL